MVTWRLGGSPIYAEAPVMNVELARLQPSKARRRMPSERRIAAAAAPQARSDHDRPQLRIEPASPTVPGVVIGPASAPPINEEREGVRKVLRGMLGCDHAALAGLSPEERRRCEERLARAPGVTIPHLNLDKGGAFAAGQDLEPYLARRPKNGCKARAGGDTAPSGDKGAAAAIGCALSF